MADRAFPDFTGGGGGGSSKVTFPLLAPPGNSAAYSFTSGGGLRGTAAGGVALMGMQGDAIVVAPDGAVNITGRLDVLGAAQLAGGLSTTAITATSGSFSSNVSVGGGLGVAGNVQSDGDLSANKITARGQLGAASIASTGPISGTSLSISGHATLGSLNVQGVFRAGAIASDGPLLFPTTTAQAPGLALSDETATGIYGAPGGNLAVAIQAQLALAFGPDLKATFHGAMVGPQGTFDSLAATTLSVAQASSLQALTATQGSFSGAVQIGGDLTVAGVTRLASLAIDQLQTDHDLQVGGQAKVLGPLVVQGATQLAALTATGPTSLANLSGQTATLAFIRVPGSGSPNYPPVLRVARPGGGTDDYTATVDGEGNLAIAKALAVGGPAHVLGGMQVDGALSALSGSFGGPVAAAGNITSQGSVAADVDLSGQRLKLGATTVSVVGQDPNGNLSGKVGDLALQTQSGLLFLKLSGAGTNTGWVAVITQASASAFPLLAGDSSDATHPQFAFTGDSRTGMGRLASGNLFLSYGGALSLQVTASGVVLAGGLSVANNASFAQDVSIGGATTLGGALSGPQAQFTALTAGTTGLGATTLASAQVSGTLAAGASTLASLQVTGASSVGGALSSSTSVAAPKVLVGTATLRSGQGDPTGQVTGSPGDAYFQTDGGAAWLKATGTDANGWVRVSTSANALTYPLQAPDGSYASPSYGFSQGGLGLTAASGGKLVGVAGGQAGWTLDGQGNLQVAGGLGVAGASVLAGVSAQGVSATSLASSGGLTVAGASSLQALQATTAQVTSLTATGVVSAQNLTASQAVAGASVAAGGNTWRAGTAIPADSSGQDGDFQTLVGAPAPMVVRFGGTWRRLALVGDAAPATFPLRGPADSASAPNFAPSSASPGSGMFSPGTDQLGFATKGVTAATVDGNGNWTFAKAVAAAAISGTGLTINGTATITGATSLSSTLQVTGAVTLAAGLSAASLTASGSLNAASASISGALSTQTLSTAGDATIGGNLVVNGTTTFAGVQKIGYIQVGDGLQSAPAVSFQSEPALGFWRPAAGQLAFAAGGANTLLLQAGLGTFPGAVRVGGTNAGLTSPGANQVSLQGGGNAGLTVAASGVATFGFQAIHVGGSTSAPGVSFPGGTTGLWSGLDAYSSTVAGVAVAGTSVAFFKAYQFNSLPVYQLNLGLPTGTTTGAGIIASAQTPNGGNFPGFGGQLFQWQGGGAGASLWVNEATSGTSNTWAKVLTTSSNISATFPLQSPNLGSPTSPAYGWSVSGYTTTGLFTAPDAGSGNIPVLGIATNGQYCAYFEYGSANSIPIYTMCFGNPAVSASPYNACLRASAQAASGNIIAAVGQLAINNVGGAGTVLAVKESGVGTSSGWSFIYTQGTAQIAGAAGSVAAPYHAFSNSVNSGFSYVNGSGVVTSVGGTQVFNIGTVGAVFSNSWVQFPAGSFSQPSITFINNTTTGFYSGTSFTNPAIYMGLGGGYWGGFVKYGSGANIGYGIDIGPTGNFANGGFIVSNALPTGNATTSPGTLVCVQSGTLWFKESGSQTQSGYAQVLTTSTQLAAGKFAYQAAAPSAVASVGQVYSLSSDGNLYYVNGAGKVSNLSAPTLAYPATNTAPAASITTTAADNTRTFVNTSATQSVVTLYTVPSSSDYQVTFVVGGAGGFSITAPSSQVIFLGANPTTNSTITSTTPGSTITLSNPGGLGTWYAVQLTGQWNF